MLRYHCEATPKNPWLWQLEVSDDWKLEELGLFGWTKESWREILSMDANIPREAMKKMDPGSVILSDRTKDNEKLKHWRVPLNIRKHFYIVWLIRHWHRLLREVMESPFLEILKKPTGNDPEQCSRWPCLSRSAGLDDLKRFLPVSTCLWFSHSEKYNAEVWISSWPT